MKTDIWIPLYIGDYMADTIGLTLAEHGAYLLAIFAYWRKHGPLTQAEMDSVCNSHCDRVCQFFVRESVGGLTVWRHKRIDLELLGSEHRKANEIKRTEAARAALAAKRQSVTKTVTKSPSPSPSPSHVLLPKEEVQRERGKASRPPAFKSPTIEAVKLQAAKIGMPETEAYKFHAHFESNGWRVGSNPMRSWTAAMQKWLLNGPRYNGGQKTLPTIENLPIRDL